MMRIILLFFIWAIAIPAHSNPYENVWYRWNTFQDTVDEKAMYLRRGYISNSGTFDIVANDFKIIKVKNSQYELFELIDYNWQKMDAHFSDKRVEYKKSIDVNTSHILDPDQLNEIYSALTDEYKSKGFTFTPVLYDLDELRKKFNDKYGILNTIDTTLFIDFSWGIFDRIKIIYDKNNISLNQNLIVIDKQANEKYSFKNLTALKINKGIKYECLALKK